MPQNNASGWILVWKKTRVVGPSGWYSLSAFELTVVDSSTRIPVISITLPGNRSFIIWLSFQWKIRANLIGPRFVFSQWESFFSPEHPSNARYSTPRAGKELSFPDARAFGEPYQSSKSARSSDTRFFRVLLAPAYIMTVKPGCLRPHLLQVIFKINFLKTIRNRRDFNSKRTFPFGKTRQSRVPK